MKKKVYIILLVVIIICIFGFIKINAYIKEIEGFKLTLVGGSTMEDKGNTHSLAYFIRTRNGELIVIDGGRDIDAEIIKEYIYEYGDGKVDHWFITHAHNDHVGAIIEILKDDNSIEIENLYYKFLSDEWYKKYDFFRYNAAHEMLKVLSNKKIKNRIECEKGQVIEFDNIRCDIIRTVNPSIKYLDSNGNDQSMVFKITAKDVNKSIIFLGDAGVPESRELLQNKDALKADSVQMAHHGQDGVTKRVYQAIDPDICYYNTPEWLWNNDIGEGYDTGDWKTVTVREWMKELNTINYVSYKGDQVFHYTRNGIVKIIQNP